MTGLVRPDTLKVLDEYSLYEAKAELSALVRQVREGRSVIITVHGKPTAELRPLAKTKQTFDERVAELTAKGEITPSKRKPEDAETLRVGRRLPGALKRFLEDR